ncbi:hypothetical protein LIW26_001730, partial [Campylobacter jejuni]|nr:hypothetical protein [Campylobacter jejuni]
YFKDQTEENFIKALNEFAKESQINSQEIKDKSFREFKEAISKLPTIDLLNTRFDKLENKLDSFKREVRTYVIILAALMFILQPTIFDLILSIFKSFLRQ